MFDNFILQVSAVTYNMLKMGGLITHEPLTGNDYFMGFKNNSGTEVPVQIKATNRHQLPPLIEMQMVQKAGDV